MTRASFLATLDTFLATPVVRRYTAAAEVTKADPAEPEWKALHRAADALQPRARAAFLQAVADTVDGVDEEALAAALRAKDYRAAFQAIPWDEVGAGTLADLMPPAMREVAQRAGVASAQVLSRAGLALDFDLVNPRMVEAANTATAELVTAVGDETKAAIRSIIGRSFSEGIPPRDAGRLIRPLIGLTERDANAVTNMWARMTEDGEDEGKIDRITGNYAERLLNGRAEMIARTECLPPETAIDGAVVEAAYRRRYDGDLIEIKTRYGRRLRATPNHPVLTKRGWVAAGAVHEGDDLVCNGREQDAGAPGDPDVVGQPPTIAEIFDAVAAIGVRERRLGSKPDFHGDGRESQVDVARPNRLLKVGMFTPLDQPAVQAMLAPSDPARAPMCDRCGCLLAINQPVCVCLRAPGNCSFFEDSQDDLSICMESRGKSRQRFPGHVAPGNRFRVKVPTIPGEGSAALVSESSHFGRRSGDSCLVQRGVDPIATQSYGLSDLAGRLTRLVQLDRVVDVTGRSFHGHVYNLSTPFGYFTANGIYTGNTIRAAQLGQEETWTQAAEQGLIDPETATRVWLAAESTRTCDICAGLDGQERGLSEPFVSDETGEEYDGPPDPHPDCRCSLGLNP